ncbi:MAG: SPOR domain-containing protein [Rhizobiaceae bacterium]|nr:SPOR domain-containing protein [Rhizobiaceae bacterium]
MVDRPQLKTATHDAFDDDPFAELTRIMGFDPRTPSAPARPAPRAVLAPQPVAAPELDPGDLGNDFSLDLERELMGEFGEEADAASAPRMMDPTPMPSVAWPAQTARMPANEPAYVEPALPHFADSRRDFETEPRSYAPAAQYEPAVADEDYGYQDELEAYGDEAAEYYAGDEAPRGYAEERAYQTHASQEPAYETHERVSPPQEFEPAAAYDEPAAREYDAGHAAARYEEAPASYDEQPHYEEERRYAETPARDEYAEAPRHREADVEAAITASLEEEFALDDDWAEERGAVHEFVPASEVVAAQSPSMAEMEDEIAADFDAAMAEVDMDFRAVAAPRMTAPEVPAAPVATAPDLEEELNALLGNMRANAAAQVAPLVVQAAPRETRRPDTEFAPVLQRGMSPAEGDNPFNEIFADPAEAKRSPQQARATAPASMRDPTAEEIENDPVNSLAAMAARLRAANRGAYWPNQQQMPASERAAAQAAAAANAYKDDDAGAPDIATVDVDEAPVALADDLDLPEVRFEEEAKAPSAAYDDLGAEFADLLGDSDKLAEPVRAPASAPRHADPMHAAGTRVDNGAAYGYAAADVLGRGVAARGSGRQESYAAEQGFYADAMSAGRPMADDSQSEAELEYDPALEDEIGLPEYVQKAQAPRRRGLMVAAIVGGVAVVGAIGAFALSFGDGSSSGVPVIVRADQSPIKVKPENPGGITVPNQDNKVYDTVAGGGATVDASQEKLVTTTEEPVQITQPEDLASDADLPLNSEAEDQDAASMAAEDGQETASAKNEDRVEQPAAEAAKPDEVAAVAPRKVRTLVVKPDGSLAANDEPAPAEDAAPAQTAAEAMEDPVVSVSEPEAETTGAVAPAPADADETASTEPAPAPAAAAKPEPEQVAAIDPATIAAGTWSMQIASQPTEAAAQSSYKDLAKRYASVLGDRQASIVKAEISGKGTFWRVRIPAGSRNEAVNLCNSYKAAGGSCFVSR